MGKRGKKKQATTTIAAPGRFVRDPAVEKFFGTAFYPYGGPEKAVYEAGCLNQNVFPLIRDVFHHHGFSPVDASTVLKLVIGCGLQRSMQFKGPVFSLKDTSLSGVTFKSVTFKGSGATFKSLLGKLLVQDRAMIDRLMHIVFSMPDSVALNSTAITLSSVVGFAEYREDTGFRKVVMFYCVGSPNDEDFMRVTIQGENDDPNTFTFDHSQTWAKNRYSRTTSATATSQN